MTDTESWLDSLVVDAAKAHDGRHIRQIVAAATAFTAAEAGLNNAVAEVPCSWAAPGQ